VTIATPPDSHAPLALEAIAAGAHVLCEKPFALDAAEAEAMVSAAAEARVVGLVGHEFRFTPSQALVARLLGEGAIGTPRLAVLTQLLDLVADPAAPMPDWWFDPARGGGWLGASGSHAVDRVRHWFGEVTAVDGLVQQRRELAEDTFVARLHTVGGCVVEITQSAAAWGPPTAVSRVVGSSGSLWIDGEDVMLADAAHPGGRVIAVPQDLQLPAAPPAAPIDGPSHRFTHIEVGPYARLCERFATAIGGGEAEGAATFTDGLAVQRILDAIRAG
jgi:predicted dehydrogenase